MSIPVPFSIGVQTAWTFEILGRAARGKEFCR
jgi:hypothetical protein